MSGTVDLHCFPSNDADFRRHVERLAKDRALTIPDEFEARIQKAYPAAVIRPRQLAAEFLTTWYVFRDGVAWDRRRGAWWRRPGCGRLRVVHRRIAEANETAHRLLRYPAGSLEGLGWELVWEPETPDEIYQALTLLNGPLFGTTALIAGDGALVPVDHRIERLGPDLIVSVRAVPLRATGYRPATSANGA